MPRSRKRTTERGKWSEETLKRAFELVQNGRSVKSVAAELNIPRITLHDRLKYNSSDKPALGRKPVFTPDQEAILTNHIKQLANTFYGITLTELRRLAYELAENLKIKHSFNKDKKMAGEDWVSSFIKRNPTISLRKPSATSLNRVLAFNISEVDIFFSNLNEVYKKQSFPATRVFNMDETGISTVQKPGKILAPKGQKQVGSVTSWERGRNITVVCAVSASGAYVPPMFIFPRKRMSPLLERGGPAGAIYRCSHNGWSNEELFNDWLHHFKDSTKPSEEDAVLLIMDNHGSHITLESFEFCRANHIKVVSIPPHTSHRLQPLDLSFYSPLKKAFNTECDRFLRANRFQKITVYDIAYIFNEAYMKVATMEKGVSGFRTAGILPFNPEKFSDLDFLPEADIQQPVVILDQDNVNESTIGEMTRQHSHSDANEEPEKSSGEKINSHPNLTLTGVYKDPVPGGSGCSAGSLPKTKPASKEQAKENTAYFEENLQIISPLPLSKNQAGSKPVSDRKQHSIILTGTPMKSVLEEAKIKKKEKEVKAKIKLEKLLDNPNGDRSKILKKLKKEKKEKTRIVEKKKKSEKDRKSKTMTKSKKMKKTCRRQIDFEESSEEDIDLDVSKLCDDDEFDDAIDLFAEDTEVCLVCGEFGSSELWFRCVSCGKWAHADCSGYDTPENYICDLCTMG